MYSDIIPPKKRLQHTRTEEYNSVRFSAPHKSYAYDQSKRKKTPFILLLAACVVIVLFAYSNLYHSTTLTLEPKVTRFQIKEKIPLVLQGREKDALTYSLVYVPAGTVQGTTTRNPFQPQITADVQNNANNANTLTITASTTGDTKRIVIINKTGNTVPLRKETRFDVDGVVYTLDVATQSTPTSKAILNTLATTTDVYKVIGFKGYSTYESVYAVPETSTSKIASKDVATTTVSVATSTTPPQDLLSLMPAGTLALQKSTIYDKLVDQSAVVVFDQSALEEFLKIQVLQTEEYYKFMKPFGESLTYEIVIADYALETAPETGKPVAFNSLTLEILPKVDERLLPLQFAGFSKDTMNTIQKQVGAYIKLDVTYRPFWTDSIADADKIKVTVHEDK